MSKKLPDGTSNLRPVETKEEARERGHNGGIKSGEVRRKKRLMRDAMKLLMDMPISNKAMPNVILNLTELGISQEDLTNQMAMLVAVMNRSLKGDIRAAEFIRDTVGTGADGIEREKRLDMDKKKFKKEMEKLEAESGNASDGMPILLDVRPEEHE